MEQATEPQSVIIVGGSLAGLMHALVLLSLPKPPKVRILERSPTALLHNQGAGVVAGNETQELFDKYVRPGRDIAITSPMRHYLDRYGHEMPASVEHRSQRMVSWDLLYHLLRWRVEGLESGYVDGLLPDQRPKAYYDNGCTITNIEDKGSQGVEVTWNSKDHEKEQTEIVDLVIAADGASSTIRRLLEPEVQRKYVGYVAWRGTVPESQLSEEAKAAFVEKFTFFHSKGTQSLGYLIPGENGTLEAGKRLFNWVWYVNHKEGSDDLNTLMTDTHGKRHNVTLPVGGMQPPIWEKQKQYARDILPPQFAEAVGKTQEPFIQAVTDVINPRCIYMNGKLLLVGDALAGFRPHTAASTSQAAFDAMTLHEWMIGAIDRNEYAKKLMDYAREVQERGVMLGERSQFGQHPLAG